jgi:hypothetical protein
MLRAMQSFASLDEKIRMFASLVTFASVSFAEKFQHCIPAQNEFNGRIIWVNPLFLHQL